MMQSSRACFSPSRLTVALLGALFAPALLAQQPVLQDERHSTPQHLDTIVVTATALPKTVEDLVRPVDVLTGTRLDAAKGNNLGQTLSNMTGIQNADFGQAVGRPVIRGLDGARVQVLSGGLGSGDVSTVSADHAISVEPFLADQIEVLKGPATLFYGSGALGGAVNVIDGRVPETLTTRPLEGRAELRAGTGNHERTGMLRLDGSNEAGFAFHFDALHREADDVRIPGFAEREGLHDDDDDDHERVHGRLPNSALRINSAALGASWIGERGFIGAAYSLYSSRYGIPGHSHVEDDPGHGHGHDHGDEDVRIVLDQRRTELRAGLNNLGFFETARLKLANTEYTHTEWEGSHIGTVFNNDTTEARLELVHRDIGAWRGAVGVQASRRNFSAIGEEAFVPANRTRDVGLFYVADASFGAFDVELGARYDRNRISTEPHILAPNRLTERRFGATSLSAAGRWNLNDTFALSLALDRAQRSPTAEELYSNGLHVATSRIEIGDDQLQKETANRVELGAHWKTDAFSLNVAGYLARYDNFTYLTSVTDLRCPGHASCRPDAVLYDGGQLVNVWAQNKAQFHGVEADLTLHLINDDSRHLDLRVFGDMVRGRLTDDTIETRNLVIFHGDHVHRRTVAIGGGTHLPRIAAPRWGAELQGDWGQWRARIGATRYAAQRRVIGGETPSDAYTLMHAGLAWHLDTRAGTAVELFADGHNLLNREARAHTSFTKDLAPLPGRSVSMGVRVLF